MIIFKGEFHTVEDLNGLLNPPRFIIRSSYGNDSIALIQWAHENELPNVVVMYSDTGWARKWWQIERIPEAERWVKSLGFRPVQVKSIGMEALIKKKKSWPFRLAQFCTQELKINPAAEWLKKHDPYCRSIILTGVRREESANRKLAPHFRLNNFNDGGRTMISPLVEYNEEQRNELLKRAGFEPLAHRSEECRCINANKDDLKRFDNNDINEIKRLETEMGFTSKNKPRVMYRPSKYMGATGIDEVVKWANSERGKYKLPDDEGECNDDGYCGS